VSGSRSNMAQPQNWVLLVTELRRYPQMSYKSDMVVLSGLDTGDRKALDVHFKKDQCLMDTEDRRFVLKGPQFPPMEVINCLVQERGYSVQYNPQQHAIPPKQGATDDKFCMIYHLSKPVPLKSTSSVTAAAGGKEASITAAESKISAEDRHHASDITDPET